MIKVNPKKIKPYGDRLDDGMIQLSFTFPHSASVELKEAAKIYVEKMGLKNVSVAVMEPMGESFTYFVVYGSSKTTIDLKRIKVPKLDFPHMEYSDLVKLMDDNLDKPLVVIGAATGSDAHTVGIDAILNMKGYDGDYGLERYPKFSVQNLRAQLSNEELVQKTIQCKADAILISQVVTQRDSHIRNLKELKKLLEKNKSKLKRNLVTIIGGPRVNHQLAVKLGFTAGFGPGTLPSQVASLIIKEYFHHKGKKVKLEKKEVEIVKADKEKSPYDEPVPVLKTTAPRIAEKKSFKSNDKSKPTKNKTYNQKTSKKINDKRKGFKKIKR